MKVKANVLASDQTNAQEIVSVAKEHVYIGFLVHQYATVQQAITEAFQWKQAKIPLSIGLGAGDPKQWKKVLDIAVEVQPAHVNQVFSAAGYTKGVLERNGGKETLVNALIRPSGTVGKVQITTGPLSSQFTETISCDAAASMLAEIGIPSIKFYPIDGLNRLDEVQAMVQSASRYGITIFEPTGGIELTAVERIIETCAEAGAKVVIPHVYSSIQDPDTGKTRISDVETLRSIIEKWC